jgi:hypothetical protein
MWPIWTKEERCNHILRCEETRGCRDELVDKRLTGRLGNWNYKDSCK